MTEATFGAAPGYVARRALTMRVELRRQIRRRGVQLAFVGMAALPCVLAGAVGAGKSGVAVNAELLTAVATSSAGNFTVFALVAGSQFGLVLMTAYLLGEAIAREGQWLHLRVLLTVPVPRGQLLYRKFVACILVCAAGMVVYVTTSIALGLVLYGSGPLTPVSGAAVPASELLWRIPAMVGYLLCYLLWIGALALFLSVLAEDNSVTAIGGTIVVTLLSHLLGGMPTLGGIRAILPTRNYDAWLALTRADVDWFGMRWGVFLSLCYTGAFLLLAHVRFITKDVNR